MSHEFFVGQRVVCVDANDARPLVKGRIYTVSGLKRGFDEYLGGQIQTGVTLVEAAAPPPYAAFSRLRFRPLRERKTDISIFTAILNGHRVPEDA